MYAKIETCDGYYLITLSGRFTFLDYGKFKNIFEEALVGGCQKCVIDLSSTEFIDSAGLGMLLMIRDELGKNNISLILKEPKGQVDKMIQASHFDQLFIIES